MRILDRYLLGGFRRAFLFCLFLFFLMFIVIDAFNNLDDFLRHSASFKIVLSYYFFSLPAIFVQITPIATLVAVLYALGNLSQHNEISALKAGGVSTVNILLPYLFTGVLISFTVFLVNERLVPASSLTSTSIMEGLIQKGKKNLEERAIKNVTLHTPDSRMVYARELELLNPVLHEVIVYDDNPHHPLQTKLTAKRGEYRDGRWTFYGVMKYQTNRRGDLTEEPSFVEKMELDLAAEPADFLKGPSQIEFMNTRQLRQTMEQTRHISQRMTRRLEVDWHDKVAFPFVSFVVMMIGAPMAMAAKKGGAIVGIGSSLALVLLYYGLDSVCLALGKGGWLPPFLAAWAGNFSFAIAGIYLIRNSA